MNKETIKGVIIGVISSLIASGIFYPITKKWLWNYNCPVWLWLSVTVGVCLIYKLIKCLIFRRRLNDILSEYKEGVFGDSFPYTWEYKKSYGPYSVYGYEPYNIKIKEETKEKRSKPDIYLFGHDVPEDALKRYIQLYVTYKMNKGLQAYILPTLKYLDYTQDSQKHQILY
ncbi:hypothetical protein [uncultured Bacteroides sp.]|uniref:hypothetical protein n=1 Tax=uncultured Bacteroides sp. TaxID=162156 RepID=UPI002634A243|nr:hypothetical protein [uncultured Bacteroides sp.]